MTSSRVCEFGWGDWRADLMRQVRRAISRIEPAPGDAWDAAASAGLDRLLAIHDELERPFGAVSSQSHCPDCERAAGDLDDAGLPQAAKAAVTDCARPRQVKGAYGRRLRFNVKHPAGRLRAWAAPELYA